MVHRPPSSSSPRRHHNHHHHHQGTIVTMTITKAPVAGESLQESPQDSTRLLPAPSALPPESGENTFSVVARIWLKYIFIVARNIFMHCIWLFHGFYDFLGNITFVDMLTSAKMLIGNINCQLLSHLIKHLICIISEAKMLDFFFFGRLSVIPVAVTLQER